MNSISLHRLVRRMAFAAVWLTLVFALVFSAGLRINPTPSLPKGIYRLVSGTPDPENFVRGDLVSFCLQGEFAELALERGYLEAGSCENGLRPLLKRLAGMPGDYIEADTLAIRSVDSQGRHIPSILQSGVIPSGMALVLADHPGSFDSRYFGLVPLESLQRAEPVFVFSESERFTKPLNGEQSPPTSLWRVLFRFASHHQSSFTAPNSKGN